MKMHKLNPGHKVYVIYDNTISLKSAAYIGQHSFIVEKYEWLVADAREFYFDDYGTTWFTSLDAAKKFLKQDNFVHGRIGKIVQLADDYWEFVKGDRK